MPVDLNRSLEFSRNLVEWVRGKGRILIFCHDNPDPDSLATAYALQHLFLVKAGQEATIAFGGIIGRGENRTMVRLLEIDAVKVQDLDLDEFNVFCAVDTQPGTGNNSIPAGVRLDVVIDHHPLREATALVRLADVREDYGAAATLLFEYLKAQEITICTKLATILFYAIKSETQDLGREWAKADREAYLSLVPLVNNHILYEITHPQAPRGYFSSFNKAIESARTYGEVLVFNLYDIEVPDMVAEMADFLLRVDDVAVVMGMGRYTGMGVLSLRTLREDLNAGDLIQQVVQGIGTAGGHGMIAGGQIRPFPEKQAQQHELEITLTGRLLEALGLEKSPGLSLLTS